MMKTILSTLAICLCIATLPVQALNVAVTPGSLTALPVLPEGDSLLRLTGRADVRDLVVLNGCGPQVGELDLSALTIEPLQAPGPLWQGRSVFEAGELPPWIFAGLPAKTVTLPANVASIGEGAFAGSSITEIALPPTVITVGAHAFRGCQSLSVAYMGPTAVRCLEEGLFAGCTSLHAVELPAGLQSIGGEAFKGTALRRLDLSAVNRLDDFALASMPLLEKIALNPTAAFGRGIMMGCGALTRIEGSPADVPDLFAAACPQADVSGVAAGATAIGAWALGSTPAPHLVLAAGLQQVGDGAFANMQGLEYISAEALRNRVPLATEALTDGIDPSAIKLYVGRGNSAAWQAAEGWSQFDISEDSAVEAVKACDGLDFIVVTDGMQLTVKAEVGIDTVSVFAADGRLLAQREADGAAETAFDAAQWPGGIVVVWVRCGTACSARTVLWQ